MKKTIFAVFLLALAVGTFAQQKSESLTTNALKVTLIDNGSKLRFDNNQNSGTVDVVLVIYWANGSSSVQSINVSKPPSTVYTSVGNKWEWRPNTDPHTIVSLNERATAIGLPTEAQRKTEEAQRKAEEVRQKEDEAKLRDPKAREEADKLRHSWAAHHFAERYDDAIAEITKAIQIYPHQALYAYRSWTYLDKGDYDRAIADATEAIRINPKFGQVYYFRAKAYAEKGNFTQARADVNMALLMNPDHEQSNKLSMDLSKQGY